MTEVFIINPLGRLPSVTVGVVITATVPPGIRVTATESCQSAAERRNSGGSKPEHEQS